MTNATGTNLCLDRTDSRAVMEEIMNLVRKEKKRTRTYPKINIPVRLIWGDKDWARPSESEHDRSLLLRAEMVTVEMAGTSCRSIDPMP